MLLARGSAGTAELFFFAAFGGGDMPPGLSEGFGSAEAHGKRRDSSEGVPRETWQEEGRMEDGMKEEWMRVKARNFC